MIIRCNCGSMITGGDRWRALQVWSGTRSVLVLIQHCISLLHVSDIHGEKKWGVSPCCCPRFPPQASNLLLGGVYELVMIRMLLLFGLKADELWQPIQISLPAASPGWSCGYDCRKQYVPAELRKYSTGKITPRPFRPFYRATPSKHMNVHCLTTQTLTAP